MDGSCQGEYLHCTDPLQARSGKMLLSLDQEPCTPVSQGIRGHVLPAHMREEVIGSYQRGFGVARIFPFGASVGFVGAGATLCGGVGLVPWMCPGADIVFVIPRSPKEVPRAMEMRVLERDMMVGCLVRGLWSDCSIFKVMTRICFFFNLQGTPGT